MTGTIKLIFDIPRINSHSKKKKKSIISDDVEKQTLDGTGLKS